MFTVGDFARLAQVSKRLLRYYDEIDLFKPNRIEPSSGYRFYSAEQMADFNRILALKELGLSLDQIRQALNDHISTDELQGMMLLKKAEIEQQLRGEIQRIRKIESRLQLIRDDESGKSPNVIVKHIPDQHVLSMRRNVDDFEAGMVLYAHLQSTLPRRLRDGFFFCICHSDYDTETNLDLEMGVIVSKPADSSLMLSDGTTLTLNELTGTTTMATTVVQGALETIHLGYASITKWIDTNGYRLAGVPRELLLQFPKTPSGNDLVTEIQFPVEAIPNW
ncbi:MAG: MerR family transcriptional regulator [Aggregatilineales bacterium]